jgi:uncharacterized membrane protein (GlpM family)
MSGSGRLCTLAEWYRVMDVYGLVFRFLLGGGAVVGSTMLARKFGGKIGGVLATFPAVYLASMLTSRLNAHGQALLRQSALLSRGALVGMCANIVFALTVAYLCHRIGWKLGLGFALAGWLTVSLVFIAMGL